MQLFSCNYYYIVTILFILNSMTVHTKHHKRQEAIIDSKKLIGLSIEDLQKTVKLYNKIMEDPSAYYESVSRIGQGRNASALIENSQNKFESTTNYLKGITEVLNNTTITEISFTPTNMNYEFLLQELNRKIKNLTIPSNSLTTTVRIEEARSSVAPGVVKVKNGSTTTTENSTTNGVHDLYNISSTIGPTMLATSQIPHFVSNPVLRKTTQKSEIYSPTNISGLLETQKEIIKQLLINIDEAQKVLTTNGTDKSSLDSTTEYRLSDESDMSLNKTNGSPINDISTILMKLAEVESNASINLTDDKKQKSKNPFTALLQKFLKTRNFADVPQI